MKRKILIFIILCSLKTAFSYSSEHKDFYIASKSFNNSITEITICEGETLELTAEPIIDATYKWETSDDVIITGINLIRNNLTLAMEGIYSLTVTTNGCIDTALINVFVLPKPNAGTNGLLKLSEVIEPTREELFKALGGNPSKNGVWTQNSNVYTYTVTSNSCKNSATSTVTVINTIKITNGFSPNGDNINDTWQITPNLLVKYPNNILRVFNRHGNKVYEAKPYKNDWDAISNGKIIINKGKKLPPNPYYYVLELNNSKKTVLKGWVYINY